jgi:hypothetical protein
MTRVNPGKATPSRRSAEPSAAQVKRSLAALKPKIEKAEQAVRRAEGQEREAHRYMADYEVDGFGTGRVSSKERLEYEGRWGAASKVLREARQTLSGLKQQQSELLALVLPPGLKVR